MSDTKKILFIYANPVSEYMWEYAVNDADKMRIIEKGELKGIIRQGIPRELHNSFFEPISEKIDRLYPVFVDFEEYTFESGDDILGEIPANLFQIKKKEQEKDVSFLEKTQDFLGKFITKSGFHSK